MLFFARRNDDEDEKFQQLFDETSLIVMKRLRENCLFKLEDIWEYDMMWLLCRQRIFPEQRFRYLADWYPGSLMLPTEGGALPFQLATWYCQDIRGFRTFLEVGIHHFPKEMGCLFHRDRHGGTAYRLACRKHGNNEVKKLLDDGFRKNHTNISTLLKSLVYACSDETVHLEGVFEILQRVLQKEPSVLFQVQAATSRNVNINNMKNDGNSHKRKRGGQYV